MSKCDIKLTCRCSVVINAITRNSCVYFLAELLRNGKVEFNVKAGEPPLLAYEAQKEPPISAK